MFPIKRRKFLQTAAAGGAVTLTKSPLVFAQNGDTPAALGGAPVRKKPFQSWPMIKDIDEKNWEKVLHDKGWCRLPNGYVVEFEKAWAEMNGVQDCVACANGTNSLFTSLNALGIGPGDEVLVPPYTFVATVNVVLLCHAIPVFVDTDRETFQMDARKIEAAITEKTRCIIPVHLGGNVADMDQILAVAKKHNLAVIEDACQSHLAEWKGKKVGSLGDTGCFSFQVTKNLSSGEGGAVISNNIELMDRVFSFHTNGRERRNQQTFGYLHNGTNVRLTEFQGALLLAQMTRLPEQADIRSRNGETLTRYLQEIPGIHPAKEYEGTTKNAYHLYMFRYDPEQFAGLSRNQFIAALQKEGIPCSSGYSPLDEQPFLKDALYSRGFEAIYGKERIDEYFKQKNLPENKQLCSEAVWFYQYMLLGEEKDMEQIATAIRKISRHASQLAKA